MECNRDEALRAKEISESKLSTKDITGAKKFALKAQTLYPGLEGISQLLAVVDIYVAAENKVDGELDYYGILGVSPSADDDTVRKSYRKLALSLHPDKNKSVGAEGAFHYVSEAWNFLSDKDKRSFYDHRRNNGRVFKQKVQRQNAGSKPPQPPKNNGFCNFTKVTTSQAKVTTTNETKVATTQKPKVTATKKTKDNTTARKTKDTTNPPKDKVNAKTVPISVPSSSNDKQKQAAPKTFWTVCRRCKLQYEFFRIYVNRNLLCPTCHGPFVAIETPAPNLNQSSSQAHEKTQGKERNTSSQWGQFLKKTNPADVTQAATIVQQAYDRAKRDREEAQAATKRDEALRRKITKKEAKSSSSKNSNLAKNKEMQDEVPQEVIKKRLMEKAKTEIKKKLHEWSSEVKVNEEVVVTDVPDPDFHDFDYERSENCFEEGQVWAAYDHHDGMPRNYGLIQKVISVNPFKMKICWLNSKVNNMICFGEFIVGKHDLVTVPNYFSHKANFKQQESGKIRVFPKKGDVCALYMNNDKTKYEIVEVDEYDEENGGVIVTPLAKVFGFKAVFHRHIDLREARLISESEMFWFSHQIPSFLLTGRESPNAPKGCRELDPAAVPVEFLRVSENVNEVEKIDDRIVDGNDSGLAQFKEKGDAGKMDVEEGC